MAVLLDDHRGVLGSDSVFGDSVLLRCGGLLLLHHPVAVRYVHLVKRRATSLLHLSRFTFIVIIIIIIIITIHIRGAIARGDCVVVHYLHHDQRAVGGTVVAFLSLYLLQSLHARGSFPPDAVDA